MAYTLSVSIFDCSFSYTKTLDIRVCDKHYLSQMTGCRLVVVFAFSADFFFRTMKCCHRKSTVLEPLPILLFRTFAKDKW